MGESNMLWEAHEQRLQAVEQASTNFMAHTKAEEFRFELISQQIANVGLKLNEAIETLGKQVAAQAARVEQHNDSLRKLVEEKGKRERRGRQVKAFVIAIGVAAVGALWSVIAGPIWNWVRQFHR